MKLSTRVAWNAVTTLVAEGLVAALQLWLTRFLFARLGDDTGLIPLLDSFVVLALMVDLGLRRALSRHLAARIALEDPDHVNKLFSTALICIMSAAVAMALAAMLAARWIVEIARVGPPWVEMAATLVRWYVGPMIVLNFLSPIYKSVLIAQNRFDLINLTRVLEIATRFTLIIGLVAATPAGLYGWAIGMGASLAVDVALSSLFARRIWPQLRFHPRQFHLRSLRDLSVLGASSVIYEQGRALGILTHPMVIQRFVGIGANAAYGPARQVVLAIDILVGAVTRQILPIATQMHVTRNLDPLREVLIRGTRFTLILGGPLCVILALYAEPLLRAWQPPNFAPHLPAATAALAFWCAINLVKYVGGTQYQVLFGMHHVWYISILEMVQSLASLAASIVLTAALVGALGEAALIGVLFPTLVGSLVARMLNTVQVARAVEIPLGWYLVEGYWGPIRAIALLIPVAWAAIWLIPPTSLATLVLSAAIPGLASLPLFYLLAMDRRDREMFKRLTGRLRGSKTPVAPASTAPETVESG